MKKYEEVEKEEESFASGGSLTGRDTQDFKWKLDKEAPKLQIEKMHTQSFRQAVSQRERKPHTTHLWYPICFINARTGHRCQCLPLFWATKIFEKDVSEWLRTTHAISTSDPKMGVTSISDLQISRMSVICQWCYMLYVTDV